MSEIYTIVPASVRPFIFIGVFAVLMLAILGLFCYIAYSARHTKFELTEGGLHIRGTLYGRFIPLASLIPEEADIVDLQGQSILRLTRRSNGVGLPGYRAGWFRFNQGKKALLFVTDPSRVVYLPTREGYPLLLSMERGEAFIDSLKRLGKSMS